MTKVLLLVDIQPDFMPGGNLAVTNGDEVVAAANMLIDKGNYDFVVASQDFHPANHGSFASTHKAEVYSMGTLGGQPQVMWPDHCVQGTPGAELHPGLNKPAVIYIQKKGLNVDIDSYSAFADNAKGAVTELADYLKAKNVTKLDVCGLASDYCVSATAIDAVTYLPGVRVTYIKDASRGVAAESTAEAEKRMAEAGVLTATVAEVIAQNKPSVETSGNLTATGQAQNKQVA